MRGSLKRRRSLSGLKEEDEFLDQVCMMMKDLEAGLGGLFEEEASFVTMSYSKAKKL